MEMMTAPLPERRLDNNEKNRIVAKLKSESEVLKLFNELTIQFEEQKKRAATLIADNKDLALQIEKEAKQANLLVIASKSRRAAELLIANKEIALQNKEKAKRAAELLVSMKELAFQNEEKAKRADELLIANKELAFQNEEKAKRADELLIALKELAFQNEEKTKRADELLIANKRLGQLAEELRESEYRFRTVADFAYDWEYWIGADDRIIYISPSCERITGYRCDEYNADQLLLKKIIHPEDARFCYDHYHRTQSMEHRHEVDEYAFRILKKDGSVAHLEHLSRPVTDEKGNYRGRRVSNREITVRIKMEAEHELANTKLTCPELVEGR
ncbi:MAG: PAS domain S-box protein [Spirochaetota bacterium]